MLKFILSITILSAITLSNSGCDFIYRLLQKEGAEERDILGESVPSVSNPAIVEVQKLLKLYGYRPGNIDGQLGLNTRNAVEQFQKDHHLKTTRFVDQETWAQLNIFSETGLVLQGEVNAKQVQIALKKARIDPGSIDGKMGRRTQEAVKKFQKTHGIPVDGLIGYKTLLNLAQYLPERATQ